MRVYVSGKITGLAWGDVQMKFARASAFLEKLGYEVENPTMYCSPAMTWEECMKIDIALLSQCDAIAMLPDWIDSRGAGIEYRLAKDLGLQVMILDEDENGTYSKREPLNEDALFNALEEVFKCEKKDIVGKNRSYPLPDARKIFVKIMREHIDMTYKNIGKLININHSTAVIAHQKANQYLSIDKYFRARYNEIEMRLNI